MAKETKVELEIPQGRLAFSMEEADTLLRMPINGGWKLPEDSEWGWTPEKGFEKKAGKGKGSSGSNGANGANEQTAE